MAFGLHHVAMPDPGDLPEVLMARMNGILVLPVTVDVKVVDTIAVCPDFGCGCSGDDVPI